MFGNPVTKEYLQGLAQAATTDFLSNGTPLTEAVVKQASACGANLTAEHVRRICEMTYHDTYERMHRQESTSADRYIVFDPPDARIAAEILQSEKVASAQRATTLPSGSLMTEKTASSSSMGSYRSTRRHSDHMLSPGDDPDLGDLPGIRNRQKEWKNNSGAYTGLSPSVFSRLQAVNQRRGSPPIVHDQRKIPLSDVSDPANANTYVDMSDGTRQVLYDPEHHTLHRFDMAKSASVPEVRGFKFKAANAFDEVTKAASADYSAPFAQAQGLHDLKRIHDALKEASASLRAELASAEGEILHSRRELSKVAYATVKDGVSVEDVLHACFSGMDWNVASQQTATKVASDLSAYLLSKEGRTAGLHLSKTASYGDVNPDHPLPAAFTKVAAVEERHIHLEIALGEIENDLEGANRALTSVLFGEKVGSAAALLRGARELAKSAKTKAKERPLLAGAAGVGSVALGAAAAHKSGLLSPRNAPGGKN